VTRYQSGAAFRQALEERLLSRSLASNIPLVRLRKTVAFDRFLARLENLQPGKWILKGGFAIQLRLADQARTTKDIDVLARKTHELPPNIPNPPAQWSKPFRKFTSDVLLQYQSLAEANLAFKHFLDPVIGKDNITLWDPSLWRWS